MLRLAERPAPLPDSTAPDAAVPRLLLHSRQERLLAEGMAARVQAPAAQLGAAVARHLNGRGAQALLVGALPFDRAARSHLFAPQRVTRGRAAVAWLQRQTAGARAPGPWTLQAQPPRADYEAAVARLVAQMRGDGDLHKVVLARTLLARSATPIDPWWLLRRTLGDRSVLHYLLPLPVETGAPPAWLVGATPELLLTRRGAAVVSAPLAGSAPRGGDETASRARAQALLRSAKDLIEHRYVVQAIADHLAPLCRQLRVPKEPGLQATASMWHLATHIEGELRDPSPAALAENSSAALAALLHPTPAICGTPRADAAQLLTELEAQPRGFYAGTFGWCDGAGNGSWHLALRCARVQGHEARLFAGAGIVADSDPQAEGAETQAKFRAMQSALEPEPKTTP